MKQRHPLEFEILLGMGSQKNAVERCPDAGFFKLQLLAVSSQLEQLLASPLAMPRGSARKAKKVQKAAKAEELDKAVLRAQLELARAERAQAEERIRRLEMQLFGSKGSSSSTDSDGSGQSESDAEASDADGQADLSEMLFDRLLQGFGEGFPASIRQSAQEALNAGPEQDEESSKGCDWIGGIRLAWTYPPTVREVKGHVQKHFPRPVQPGDLLIKIDGKSVDGMSRKNILGLLRKFKGSVSFRRGDHQQAIRQSAKDALKHGPQRDAEHREGQNWIWGFLMAWTSPPVVRDVKPEVQEHFKSPISPGDSLHQVDGKRVGELTRRQILELLQNYRGSIGFKSGKDEEFRKSAEEALRSGPQEDAESGKGCDWIGGILLAWTSPPVVRDVKPEVQKHFPKRIAAGHILHAVDDKRVGNLSRSEILRLLQKHKGGLCFRECADMDEKVRSSAQEAMRSGPQEDAESGKGCDWIGGILLAWTSPPVVRDVKPEVQKHFPNPIAAGDILRLVDGKRVAEMSRAEILGLLRDFKGSLGFSGGRTMDEDVRLSAQRALDHGPQEDEDTRKGCDWIGGILLAWTSPPVVRDVKPEVQKHFARPISPGDVLQSVGGEEVQHMSRDEILRAFVHFDGELGFRSKQPLDISLADLLRRLGDP